MIITPDMPYEPYSTVEESGQLLAMADVITGTDRDEGTAIKILAISDYPHHANGMWTSIGHPGEIEMVMDHGSPAFGVMHVIITPEEARFLACKLIVAAEAAEKLQ